MPTLRFSFDCPSGDDSGKYVVTYFEAIWETYFC